MCFYMLFVVYHICARVFTSAAEEFGSSGGGGQHLCDSRLEQADGGHDMIPGGSGWWMIHDSPIPYLLSTSKL
jgi:hypothetical protein